jgi:hypothetical protein
MIRDYVQWGGMRLDAVTVDRVRRVGGDGRVVCPSGLRTVILGRICAWRFEGFAHRQR